VKGELKSITAARGLAALAVAFFHANASMHFMGAPTVPIFSVGENGVDFFFVLSGFIIAWVHGRDIDRPQRAFDYAAKRFIRLFPILWIVVGGWLLVRLALGDVQQNAVGTSLLLYPSMIKPAPLVVWTLRHELIFYCAFSLLILDRRWGETLFVSWAALCLLQVVLSILGSPVTGLPALFLSSFNLDFMLGMAVAGAHRLFRFKDGMAPLWIGLAAVAAIMLLREIFGGGRLGMLDYVSPGATAWTLALGASFALLLHGLLCAEDRMTIPTPLLMLGASSYSLYLAHTALNSATQHVGILLPVGASQLFMVAAAVIGGWLLYSRVEKPLSDFLRGMLKRRRPQAA
jgi:peptidoglycan/LPS O-acetylase OafA/YrhL